MTRHKHTPGPWFVKSSNKTPIYVSPVDHQEQIDICNVTVTDEDRRSDLGEWIYSDQTKASSKLIASSPMLLNDLVSSGGPMLAASVFLFSFFIVPTAAKATGVLL